MSDPIWTPLLVVPSQVPELIGPHRKNFSVPVQLPVPVTVRSAWSFAVTVPVPIERALVESGSSGAVVLPAPFFGVVEMFVPQLPTWPRARSWSDESTACDERVFITIVDVHSLCRPNAVRFNPPSK